MDVPRHREQFCLIKPYLFSKFFNWQKIALQCCVGFCCSTIGISHVYVCVCVFLPSLPSLPSLHPTPLGHHRTPGWAPSLIEQLPNNYLFYISQCIHVNATFSVCPTLTFPHCVHKFVVQQVHQYHFSRFHIYVLTYHTGFSLSISLLKTLGSSTSLQLAQICFFLWLSNIPLYKFTTTVLTINYNKVSAHTIQNDHHQKKPTNNKCRRGCG